MNTAGGSRKPERYTTLTRTVSASGSLPATGSVTRKTQWTGTTKSTPRSGGTAGRPSPTAIWKLLADYQSREWRMFRDKIIVRDMGCDLGVPDHEITDWVIRNGKIIRPDTQSNPLWGR